MKKLLILLIFTAIGGFYKEVQTESELKKSNEVKSMEDKKIEESIKQRDVSHIFISPESQKLNEMVKSMDVTLLNKHPKKVHETFKNMFYASDEEFNEAVKFHKDIDAFIEWSRKKK